MSDGKPPIRLEISNSEILSVPAHESFDAFILGKMQEAGMPVTYGGLDMEQGSLKAYSHNDRHCRVFVWGWK